ncbi:MAG: tetratricopeptide repeat protein [Erysipelotrichaceae bacterium]|nr:tetratricopeptide repeat protein [Erysipelotrichaceae bacterium]
MLNKAQADQLEAMMEEVKSMMSKGMPERHDDLRYLAERLEKIGDLKLKNKSNDEDAINCLIAAFDIYKDLDTENATLSAMCDRIANIYYKTGQPEALEKAITYYTKGINYKKRIYGDNVSLASAAELAIMYERIGNINYIFGDDQHLLSAVKAYEAAEDYQKEIYNEKPTSTNRNHLASGYYKIANIYYRLDHPDYYSKAVNFYGQALNYYMGASEDPMTQQRNLANVYNAMGNAYMKFGRDDYTAQAIDCYSNSIVARVSLKNRTVANQHSFVVTYNSLGDAFVILKDYNNAIASYSEALKINKRLYKQNRDDDHLRHMGDSYYYRGVARLANGEEAGIEDLLKCLDYRKSLLDNAPNDQNYALFSLILNKLGNAYFDLGGTDHLYQAIDMYESSIALNKRLIVKNNQVSINDMAISYTNLARAYKELGDEEALKKGLHVYQTGLIFMDDYMQSHRTHDMIKMMASSYNDCAHLCLKLDNNTAIELYEKAFDLMAEAARLKDGDQDDLRNAAKNLLYAYSQFNKTDIVKIINVHNIVGEICATYTKQIERLLDGVQGVQFSYQVVEKKQQTAINYYGSTLTPDDIIAYVDFTRLHSFKSGMIITKDTVYASFLPKQTGLYLGGIVSVDGESKQLVIHYDDGTEMILECNTRDAMVKDILTHLVMD